MLNGLLGKKIEMSQVFDEQGRVTPVTILEVGPCKIVQIKNNGVIAQIGFGEKKGRPRYLKEVTAVSKEIEEGKVVSISEVFKSGDKVIVTGISKGKGFAGVVKRWGFAGGPATHGQSDRLRAPGSIGTQSKGRVWKGKKMAGRMGGEKVTVKGLEIVEVDEKNNLVKVKGAIPGARNSVVLVRKQ